MKRGREHPGRGAALMPATAGCLAQIENHYIARSLWVIYLRNRAHGADTASANTREVLVLTFEVDCERCGI